MLLFDFRFVLPIGATVNMNGSALYEAVAPIFIAQVLLFTSYFSTLIIELKSLGNLKNSIIYRFVILNFHIRWFGCNL